jgi:hypothetical protein
VDKCGNLIVRKKNAGVSFFQEALTEQDVYKKEKAQQINMFGLFLYN